jgi:hypothetical protein
MQLAPDTELDTVRGRRGRILAGTLALSALSLVTVGSGFAAASAAPADDSGHDTAIVECRSGIVTDGDIQTSSISVTKVPAAPLPELPGGCSVRP